MRTIRDLLANEESVWMYLKSEDDCKAFYKQAHEEGFRFGDMPYEQWVVGHVVTVHSNGHMGHLPLFVWTAAFGPDGWRGIKGAHTPIDYARYAASEANYICTSSHFKRVDVIAPAAQSDVQML